MACETSTTTSLAIYLCQYGTTASIDYTLRVCESHLANWSSYRVFQSLEEMPRKSKGKRTVCKKTALQSPTATGTSTPSTSEDILKQVETAAKEGCFNAAFDVVQTEIRKGNITKPPAPSPANDLLFVRFDDALRNQDLNAVADIANELLLKEGLDPNAHACIQSSVKNISALDNLTGDELEDALQQLEQSFGLYDKMFNAERRQQLEQVVEYFREKNKDRFDFHRKQLRQIEKAKSTSSEEPEDQAQTEYEAFLHRTAGLTERSAETSEGDSGVMDDRDFPRAT
ncbi:hypothetical protein BDZ45DRAFT_747679 [Acephala macrosclerotiorum]|nr:hypothetical protein BDZ45DRAFT_747679 [Acephala macrosclerotiorum]